ncbi:MAG: 50S ribosomal protein L29 [Candidatus Woesearchaeota archaeon]
MKIKELRALGETELKQKMDELRKELMKDNAQVATGTIPKNPGKLRLAKKTIARIHTILAQKASPAKAGGASPEAPKKA